MFLAALSVLKRARWGRTKSLNRESTNGFKNERPSQIPWMAASNEIDPINRNDHANFHMPSGD
jgi:hypothetical protein